jgi:hypothetical protein
VAQAVDIGVEFPCAIDASIWRSNVTICSALNLFFGMTQAPFQAHSLTTLGSKKPGQVKAAARAEPVAFEAARRNAAARAVGHPPTWRGNGMSRKAELALDVLKPMVERGLNAKKIAHETGIQLRTVQRRLKALGLRKPKVGSPPRSGSAADPRLCLIS